MSYQDEIQVRQRWLSVLARASLNVLQQAWSDLDAPPACEILRAPERGLMMVRGQAGGDGQPFNLGEATVARCSVRSPQGHIGHGYTLGGDVAKAELIARFDALLQDPNRQATLTQSLIDPLAQSQADNQHQRARKAAATKVDFFTMVRGS